MLIYATCSLSRVENSDVVNAFLTNHPEYSAPATVRTFGCPQDAAGLTFLPAIHDTDGYFVSRMHRLA
jgi:16S rRNA (cytosine967-C5)-methyltransferase